MKDWTFSISIKAGPCIWCFVLIALDLLFPPSLWTFWHSRAEVCSWVYREPRHPWGPRQSLRWEEVLPSQPQPTYKKYRSLNSLCGIFIKLNLKYTTCKTSFSWSAFLAGILFVYGSNNAEVLNKRSNKAARVMNRSNTRLFISKAPKSRWKGERWRHRRCCLISGFWSLICHVIEKPSILLGPGD